MKRVQRFFAASLLIVMSLSMSACFEYNPIIYDGPPLLEIAPYPQTGSYNQIFTYTHNQANTFTDLTVPVVAQLIAPHQDRDISVSYQVTTTGTAGTHYTLTPSAMTGTMTIPAGSSSASIGLVLHRGNVAPGTSFSITIELTDGDVELTSYNTLRYEVRRGAAPATP
jgi:hypothetical protein